MIIRKAVLSDLQELTDIYNDEVLHGTATFDLDPKTYEQRREWFDSHNKDNHPLYVSEENGKVTGYISLSCYNPKEAYRSTCELSVYIARDFRHQGIASALMRFLLEEVKKEGNVHTIVSLITSGNAGSIRLHQEFGFHYAGTLKEVGYKMGAYRDVDQYYLNLQDIR